MRNDPTAFAALLAPRPRSAHKGDFGTVAVIGGNRGMVGAALLAARAALRIGAGRVYLDCIGAPDLRVDVLQPELMFRSERELPDPVDALVVGCGLGADPPARAALERALGRNGALVLDADALNGLAADPGAAQALRTRTDVQVITPHPGEAARLLGCGIPAIQADRVASAQELARRFSAIAVLKGAATVIAEPSGSYATNPTGNPALASAGTGDALAGMIGGLLAQGYPAVEAVRGAVWLHGRAAELHGADVGLTASEIAPLALRAWTMLRESAS